MLAVHHSCGRCGNVKGCTVKAPAGGFGEPEMMKICAAGLDNTDGGARARTDASHGRATVHPLVYLVH